MNPKKGRETVTHGGQEMGLNPQNGLQRVYTQTTVNSSLTGIDALETLACWEAKFVLLSGRSKRPIEDDWQVNARSLNDAIKHVRNGQNVGIVCGEVSAYMGMLDIDKPPITYPDFCERFPEYARTATLFRRNAPHKAKLIFKIKVGPNDVMPSGKKYRLPNPEGKTQKIFGYDFS